MSPAQGHISQVLVYDYVYDPVGDLTALTVGIGHIGGRGFKFGCFEGLHDTLLSVAVCTFAAAARRSRILDEGTMVPEFPKWNISAHWLAQYSPSNTPFAPRKRGDINHRLCSDERIPIFFHLRKSSTAT
jgi:hypothetical protein